MDDLVLRRLDDPDEVRKFKLEPGATFQVGSGHDRCVLGDLPAHQATISPPTEPVVHGEAYRDALECVVPALSRLPLRRREALVHP